MYIGTFLNQKESMRKDKRKEKEVIGKAVKSGNFSFSRVQPNKSKKKED